MNRNYDLQRYHPKIVILAVLAGIVLNGFLNLLCESLRLPIFLDSVFTITVAACFGAVPGLVVGIATNFFEELLRGYQGNFWPFAVVNACSALITAFLVRRGFARTLVGIFWLLAALALGNALLGALIVTLVFGGITGEPLDAVVRSLIITGQSVFTAAFLGRIFINVVDKGIALFVMVPLYRLLSKRESDTGPFADM